MKEKLGTPSSEVARGGGKRISWSSNAQIKDALEWEKTGEGGEKAKLLRSCEEKQIVFFFFWCWKLKLQVESWHWRLWAGISLQRWRRTTTTTPTPRTWQSGKKRVKSVRGGGGYSDPGKGRERSGTQLTPGEREYACVVVAMADSPAKTLCKSPTPLPSTRSSNLPPHFALIS